MSEKATVLSEETEELLVAGKPDLVDNFVQATGRDFKVERHGHDLVTATLVVEEDDAESLKALLAQARSRSFHPCLNSASLAERALSQDLQDCGIELEDISFSYSRRYTTGTIAISTTAAELRELDLDRVYEISRDLNFLIEFADEKLRTEFYSVELRLKQKRPVAGIVGSAMYDV